MKRNTVIAEVEHLVGNNAFGVGEVACVHKENGQWIMVDNDGERWLVFGSNLRNKDCYRPIKEMSVSDIIYELYERDGDYQTVAWGLLEEAIETALRESKSCSIENVINYIMENLI